MPVNDTCPHHKLPGDVRKPFGDGFSLYEQRSLAPCGGEVNSLVGQGQHLSRDADREWKRKRKPETATLITWVKGFWFTKGL